MKKWFVCVCLVLILAVTAACGNTAAPGDTPAAEAEVIGTVNGENIYRYEYDFYFNMYFSESFNSYYESLKMIQGVDMLDEESAGAYLGDLESYAWDSTVSAALIRQMADKEYNIQIAPNYTEELLLPAYSLSMKTNRLYMELFPLFKQEALDGRSMSDEEARALYDSDPAAWDCRRAAHIIVQPADDSEEAKAAAKAQIEDVIAQLNAGADFAEMAQQYSGDSSAANGGDMDFYFNRSGGGVSEEGGFDPVFAEATFELANIGDYTTAPVESSFGYHIIKLMDEKAGFDAVKDYILQNSNTITDEEVSTYFNEKMQEKQGAATIERNFEFKYFSEPVEGEEGAEEAAE